MSRQGGPLPSRGAAIAIWALAVCGTVGAGTVAASVVLAALAQIVPEPIVPVPLPPATDVDKQALGEKLFHDTRVSRSNSVACSSCHRLDEGGDDNVARAPGANGAALPFNAPTVFNVALNFRFNWRGNFRTLEEQAESALLDPRLMAISWDELLGRLRSDSEYRQAFAAVYGGEPQASHVLDALAAYEATLLTPDAPFDRYLRGEREAITADAERGYQLFKLHGCVSCHQGINVGGNLFQKFGIFENPFAAGERIEEDEGRFTITGRERDRRVFRVPSLRNVGVTAPYFHDGSAATLDQAVSRMAQSQLGRVLADREIELIIEFLESLTGEHRGRSLADQAGSLR